MKVDPHPNKCCSLCLTKAISSSVVHMTVLYIFENGCWKVVEFIPYLPIQPF